MVLLQQTQEEERAEEAVKQSLWNTLILPQVKDDNFHLWNKKEWMFSRTSRYMSELQVFRLDQGDDTGVVTFKVSSWFSGISVHLETESSS